MLWSLSGLRINKYYDWQRGLLDGRQASGVWFHGQEHSIMGGCDWGRGRKAGGRQRYNFQVRWWWMDGGLVGYWIDLGCVCVLPGDVAVSCCNVWPQF